MALLKFKRSAVPAKVPSIVDLDLGELAINTYDGKVYTKKDDGTQAIVEVGGGGTVTSVGGTGTVSGLTLSGTVTSAGNLTLGGTLSGVSLTTQVTGILPVSNGGTGATTPDYLTSFQTLSNFTLGTLIRTNITSGSWNMELHGKSYSGTQPPHLILAQAYLYSNQQYNASGINVSGSPITTIDAFIYDGVLHIWIPPTSYWNSFNVRVWSSTGVVAASKNAVTAVTNVAKPITGLTYDNTIPLKSGWNSGNFTPSDYLPLTGGTLSGDLIATSFTTASGTNGRARLHQGTASNTGYIDLLDASGTRLGYMGYGNASYIELSSVGGRYYRFTDTPRVGATAVALTTDLASYLPLSGGQLTGRILGDGSMDRVKYAVWPSTVYGIGMGSGYTFGGLNDYAMTFQMSGATTRGWWWGQDTQTNAQGFMALNQQGDLTVATAIRVGYGVGDTTNPSAYALDVSGEAYISGNVGIGTASPVEKLRVEGNVIVPISKSFFSYTNNYGIGTPDSNGLQIFTDAADVMRLGHRTGGTTFTERMRIDSSGRVGIGTSSPSSKFTVAGASSVNGIDLQVDAANAVNSARMFWTNGTAGQGCAIYNTGGHLNFTTGATPNSTSGTSRLSLYSIGYNQSHVDFRAPIFRDSNNTAYYLDPAGNSILGGNLTLQSTGSVTLTLEADTDNITETDNPKIIFKQDGGAVVGRIGYASGANILELINEYPDSLILGTSNSTDLTINASGNVIAAVDVRAPIFYDSANTAYYVDPASTGTSLNVAGSIVAAGNVTAYSDERLKENIETIPSALDKIGQIRGVTYTRNDLDDKERRYAGVIAQEIEVVLPEAVRDIGEIKAVDYNATIALLIEAVKELKDEVASLKNWKDK
jgi:hypothetical protein